MAVYGTKDYYEEKVSEAATRLDMLSYALKHKVKEEVRDHNLYNMCKTYIEAYEDYQNLEEKLRECCKHERSSEEGT